MQDDSAFTELDETVLMAVKRDKTYTTFLNGLVTDRLAREIPAGIVGVLRQTASYLVKSQSQEFQAALAAADDAQRLAASREVNDRADVLYAALQGIQRFRDAIASTWDQVNAQIEILKRRSQVGGADGSTSDDSGSEGFYDDDLSEEDIPGLEEELRAIAELDSEATRLGEFGVWMFQRLDTS